MDLFEGQADPDHQIHDYNPGIPESGLFWTMAIPPDRVAADLGAASASFRLTDHEIDDYYDVRSALTGGPSEPAVVSFDVRWADARRRAWIRDKQNGFAGYFIENTASIEWSAAQEGFEFVSESATNVFSVVGREFNGVFFK